MFKRIITGLLLVGLVVGCLLLRIVDDRLFCILIYACSFVGSIEMIKALDYRINIFQRGVIIAFSLCFYPAYMFLDGKSAVIIAFCASLLAVVSLVADFDNLEIDSVGYTLLGCFYPTVTFFPVILMNAFTANSLLALLLTFTVAPCADTFAYFIGSYFKGRKLSPKISPKKTVSGAIGGIIGGVTGAILLWFFYGKGKITNVWIIELLIYVIVGIVGALVSILGDLIEGAIKRKLTVKDMGHILPGHGGVLDRIDGIMFNGIFIYVLFTFMG